MVFSLTVWSSCTYLRARRRTPTTSGSLLSGRSDGCPKSFGWRTRSLADASFASLIFFASRSSQRCAILEQFGIPFDVALPRFEEDDRFDADPVELVREQAHGKAAFVAAEADGWLVLGVDTIVVFAGRIYGKPQDATEAERMLDELSGNTHLVVSGLCLRTPGWQVVEHETTRVTFRTLTPRDLAAYVATGE